MRLLSPSLRKVLAGVCFALSSVWAVAGSFKLIFGVRVTFPLLPPVDLQHVAPAPALTIALVLIFVGGWLGRTDLNSAAEGEELESMDQRTLPSEQLPMPPIPPAPDHTRVNARRRNLP